MAKNTLFSELELKEFKVLLKKCTINPIEITNTPPGYGSEISKKIVSKIKDKLSDLPCYKDSQIVFLGSIATNCVSFNSDIDAVFLGPEKSVKEFMHAAQQAGIRIRGRTPLNPKNLTEGVDFFDLISLSQSEVLSNEIRKHLEEKKVLKSIIRAISEDRAKRSKTYDSLTNFLEPNIKQGPGGLRDLEQALWVRSVFQNKFKNLDYDKMVLQTYREFFLLIRHHLHIEGFSDILVGSEQERISKELGFENTHVFMREVQKAISRVSFYSDFIIELALRGRSVPDQIIKKKAETLRLLIKSPSLENQFIVRRSLDRAFGNPKVPNRKLLQRIFDKNFSDKSLVAVFRSRMIDKLLPRISRLVGHVQLDHYHRLTADNHILQALREVKRVWRRPRVLMALKKYAAELNSYDYMVLCWTALYHDLAKGMSGDHSTLGVDLVRSDFKRMGLSKKLTQDVEWMAREHLSLSQAAFRRNPEDEDTIKDLISRGITGERLKRLLIFTAVDILATNPEAWTLWKSEMLEKLYLRLSSGGAFDLSILMQNKKWGFLSKSLDHQLFQKISLKRLIRDLEKTSPKNKNLQISVYQIKHNRYLIRFYKAEDEKGLLLQLVSRFFKAGFSVSQAFIHTVPDFGVYDFFEIRTQKNKKHIESALLSEVVLTDKEWAVLEKAHFIQEIDSHETHKEQLVLFRGMDQRGFLLLALKKLTELGLSIKSAKVVSWGGAVEDVFTVERHPHFQSIQRSLLGRPPA